MQLCMRVKPILWKVLAGLLVIALVVFKYIMNKQARELSRLEADQERGEIEKLVLNVHQKNDETKCKGEVLEKKIARIDKELDAAKVKIETIRQQREVMAGTDETLKALLDNIRLHITSKG